MQFCCPTQAMIILIIFGEKCKFWSSSLLLLRPSRPRIFSSAPCSQTHSVCVLSSMLETRVYIHTELQAI
jgi:hypothetical protein